METFYYVHNRGLGNPTHRHSTEADAIKEAVRLSTLYKKNFYVLKATAHITYNHGRGTVNIETNNKDIIDRLK